MRTWLIVLALCSACMSDEPAASSPGETEVTQDLQNRKCQVSIVRNGMREVWNNGSEMGDGKACCISQVNTCFGCDPPHQDVTCFFF